MFEILTILELAELVHIVGYRVDWNQTKETKIFTIHEQMCVFILTTGFEKNFQLCQK